MRTKRSLVQIYLLSLVALSAIPLAIFGYIWIAKEYEGYTEQSEAWRDTYVESRRELLRREVGKAVEYLDYRHKQLNRQLYNDLRQQVAVGITLVEDTRKEFVGESKAEQLTRLRATMASLRFSDNKGFFFLFDDQGRALLPPLDAAAEQRMTESSMLTSFSSQIRAALSDKKYDFLEYRFTDRNSDVAPERNFSFVYYYKPLNIYMGASIYLRDELNRLKNEVIERIAAVPIDPDNSILFVVDKDGRQLVNAYDPSNVGSFMPNIVDVSARVGGDEQSLFTELSWLDRDGQRKPVITYIRRFEPWGWVLGSGVFLGELNVKLADERTALQARVKEHIVFIVVIAFVLMIFSTIAARWLARRSAAGFHIFQQFFADASKSSTAIEVARLPFAEFQRLAEDANYMVEQRTETERALKLSERGFQLALDAAQNHLWDLDLQTGLVTVGESFFRLLGYDAPVKPYPVGAFKNIAYGDDLQIIASAVDSWLGLATGNSVEFRVKDRAGNSRWIYSRGDVVESDENDQPVRAMGIMTDVTDRKRIEQELVNARIAAEDALHAKSQFLSSVSHELRTPLNGVLGYTQLLQRDTGIPLGSQEYLRAIESCGKHLLMLINDVLDLAKIESGNIDIVCRPNKLGDIVSNVSDIVANRAKSKSLEFVVDLAPDLPVQVQVDEVKLRQVLVNLLDNAVKFTSSGKVVLKLHAAIETTQLMFSVTDSGIGIPQEKLRDVFEPFRQVNPQDGKGTGLGLSICRRLVEAMGGNLNVSSEFGKGSCFYFDVPLLEIGASEYINELATEAADLSPKLLATTQNPAIIIADDVAVNRHILLSILEDVTTDVREAVNGLEVIEHLKERTAQLVLMDLRMPEMDGMEATRVIKQEMGMKGVAIIIASATTDEEMMEEAVQVGCDGFLPKPISIGDLLKVVASTCGGQAQNTVAIPLQVAANVVPLSDFVLPKAQDLQELSAAVDLGDVTRLRELLQQLRKLSPECDGFIDEAEEYLGEFDFDKMARLLVQASQEASVNNG
jgi:signal transduction histidine kinase/DNA-binding NarL/FixJ family response regulator